MAQIIRNLGGCAPEDVEKVVVRCNPVVAKDNADCNPTTLLGARLSMPFNLALVLARGDVHTGDVSEHDLNESRIRNTLNKVHLESDAVMPRFGSSVTLTLRDGRRCEAAVLEPLGDPGTPWGWKDVVEKFGRLTAGIVQPSSVPAIAEVVQNIEHADGAILAQALRASLIA
jgi:2-methylcitrate dehydratase PrpD